VPETHKQQGAGNPAAFHQRSSLLPTATKAARNGAAAPAAAIAPVTETVAAAFSPTGTVAGDIVTRSVAAVTSILRSAAGKARELSDGFAAEVKKAAALTMDAYQQAIKRQLDLSIGLADAVKVDWVSELTRRNAMVIGELVAVYASATHDLLK